MEDLHLIVGLGNPGAEYAKTRHNAGFMLVESLATRWRADWNNEKKFQSRVAKTERNGKRLVLGEPQTFMNLSGEAVGALVKFYQLSLKQVIVAVDDADLPLGEIRLRPSGSSGGHHGLESIEQHLSSRSMRACESGLVGKTRNGKSPGTSWGRLSKDELVVMEKVLVRAADQVECWLAHGLQKAMSQFNGVIEDSSNEGKKQ